MKNFQTAEGVILPAEGVPFKQPCLPKKTERSRLLPLRPNGYLSIGYENQQQISKNFKAGGCLVVARIFCRIKLNKDLRSIKVTKLSQVLRRDYVPN